MSEPNTVDIESARLWLSHDNQDNLTLEFGKRLCNEVESLRARVKMLEAKNAELWDSLNDDYDDDL